MKKRFLSVVLCVVMVGVMLLGCGKKEDSKGTDSASDGKYKIALSNSYMGNDWRQLMIKTTEVMANKPEYKDKVELTVFNTENTAEDQAASIDAIVEQGYDAILIDAASATALTPAINRAIQKGIVCVTFDSCAEADGIYTVTTDLEALATGWATYLVKAMGGSGKIAVDIGLPGSTNGNTVYDTVMKIFKENGIEVVAEFAGEYADGVGQKEISSILAANPDLDGIFTQVYGETIASAFKDAGRDLIPCTAYNTNAGMLAALDNDMNICIGNNAPGLGAVAMSVAVRVLDGEDVEQVTNLTPGFFVTDTSIDIGYDTEAIEENTNCFRELPGAFDWPVLPKDFVPQLTVEDVSDYAGK